MHITDDTPAINRLAAVRLWFLQNGLQLNADKSEVVFLGTAAQLRSVANITTIDVAGSTLPVAPQLKSQFGWSSSGQWLVRYATTADGTALPP